MTSSNEVTVHVDSSEGIIAAREKARAVAKEIGFTGTSLTVIVTAVSELARNIVSYAGEGDIILEKRDEGRYAGLRVVATDSGPGIPDVASAVRDGFSTSGGLGLGLGGARRLMDEFHIETEIEGPRKGTTVTATKWLK